MVKTMVSCRFSLKPIHWDIVWHCLWLPASDGLSWTATWRVSMFARLTIYTAGTQSTEPTRAHNWPFPYLPCFETFKDSTIDFLGCIFPPTVPIWNHQEDFFSMIRSLQEVALAAAVSFLVVLALSYSCLAYPHGVTMVPGGFKSGKWCMYVLCYLEVV